MLIKQTTLGELSHRPDLGSGEVASTKGKARDNDTLCIDPSGPGWMYRERARWLSSNPRTYSRHRAIADGHVDAANCPSLHYRSHLFRSRNPHSSLDEGHPDGAGVTSEVEPIARSDFPCR